VEAVIRSEDESAWLRILGRRVVADHDVISVAHCENEPKDRCGENHGYDHNCLYRLSHIQAFFILQENTKLWKIIVKLSFCTCPKNELPGQVLFSILDSSRPTTGFAF
jgi:hypothetical protein